MQEANEKLVDSVINIAVQTVVGVLENYYVVRNKAFIKGTLRNALNRS